MALSIASSCEPHFPEIRDILEPACHRIRDWGNAHEMLPIREQIFDSLESIFRKFHHLQQPLLLQPIWKTKGKSAELADHCLDIFSWTDFALTRIFMDSATTSTRQSEKISRPQRTALRLARFLYEVSSKRSVYQQPIYDGMTFDTLNDKEFAISGSKTNQYMACDQCY